MRGVSFKSASSAAESGAVDGGCVAVEGGRTRPVGVEGLLEVGMAAFDRLGAAERGVSSLILDLAGLLREVGRLEEAEKLLVEALAARRLTLGRRHEDTLEATSAFALLLKEQGRLAESRVLLESLLEERRTAYGVDHPETLTVMNNLGCLLKATGELKAAEALLTRTLLERQRVLGDSHMDTLTSTNNLATLLAQEGQGSEAEGLLVGAVEKACHALGGNDPHTIKFVANLSQIRHSKHKAKASKMWQRAAVAMHAVKQKAKAAAAI